MVAHSPMSVRASSATKLLSNKYMKKVFYLKFIVHTK